MKIANRILLAALAVATLVSLSGCYYSGDYCAPSYGRGYGYAPAPAYHSTYRGYPPYGGGGYRGGYGGGGYRGGGYCY